MPPRVKRMIEDRADAVGFAEMKRAATALSVAYREGQPPAKVHLAEAYMATRMPATFAAVHRALGEARLHDIATALDAGAGTGAASLAVREYFPDAAITMLERDAALAAAARELLGDAQTMPADLTHLQSFPQHDLVIAAYSLGELGTRAVAVAKRLWDAARVAFIAIEPGTPKGFALIRELRDALLTSGAHPVAPCPGSMPCPMNPGDWCHFAARVERSSLHRRLKEGGLGYEDEKFSYIAVSKSSAELPAARVVRRPQQQPGLILLDTCTPEGLVASRVTKRDRAAFRAARHAAWGDAIVTPNDEPSAP